MPIKRKHVVWGAAAVALASLAVKAYVLLRGPEGVTLADPWWVLMLGWSAAIAMFAWGAHSGARPPREVEASFLKPSGDVMRDAEWARQVLVDISNALPVAVYHMENAPDGYRKFNFVSARTASVLGVSSEEIIQYPARRWRNLYPEDLAHMLGELERTTRDAVAHGLDAPPFDVEFRMAIDGEERWGQVKSFPIRFRENRTSVWCGYYEDVTERKRMELALRTANEEMAAILDASTVGMVFLRGGHIQRANTSLAEMFGVELGALIGRPTDMLLPFLPEMAAMRPQIVARIRAGETYAIETDLLRTGHAPMRVMATGRSIYRHQPQLGELWLVENVTQRHADHQALREAKEQAEAAAQARSAFLANMSHEIRTPMNAIVGFGHLLERTPLTPPQHDHLRRIALSSRHLLGVLNDILDFSKAEAGRLAIEHTPFELDQVLDTLFNVVAPLANDKGLVLTCALAADVPGRLVGDPLRLGQVLINYVNNAIKFTERGDIHLQIRREPPSNDSGETAQDLRLRFEVTDTGIGLSPEQAGRLFQNFVQADASTTRKFGGTGLGLAISKTLAELMGGGVGVRSQAGVGSTFWFTAQLAADMAPPPPLPDGLSGLGALVVGSHGRAAHLLAQQLAACGLAVVTAHNTAQARVCLERALQTGRPFDLLFLEPPLRATGSPVPWAEWRTQGLCSGAQVVVTCPVGLGSDGHGSGAGNGDGDVLLLHTPATATAVREALQGVLARRAGHGPGHSVQAPAAEGLRGGTREALRGAHVLLVDDNLLNRQLGQALLGEAGLVTDTAHNGQEAVHKVRAGHYDLVLMDKHMPEMDGIEATRLLRGDPALAELPILALTASAVAADRQACLDAGMNDCLTKPIDPEALWAALRRWIRPRPGLGPSADAVATSPVSPTSAVAEVAAHGEVGRVALPAEVDGVDIAQGLRLAGGRPATYLRLARGFVEAQASTVAGIRGDLAAGAVDAAERAVHTLKGLAGQLGAQRLAEVADAVEASLRVRQLSNVTRQLAPLEAELARVVAGLGSVLSLAPVPPASTPGASTVAVDADEVARVLAQWDAWLRLGDVEACLTLERHRVLLQQVLGPDFAPFVACLESYDFESAQALLQRRAIIGA